jgi:hypothetical protein
VRVLNGLIFIASVLVSSAGVASDNLTTRKFINDIGIEYERNCIFKKIYKNWGQKAWIFVVEVPIIVGLGLADSHFGTLLGIAFLLFKSLAATHNYWHLIRKYQKMGVENFRDYDKKNREPFNGLSIVNRFKLRKSYSVAFLLCIPTLIAVFSVCCAFNVQIPVLVSIIGLIVGLMSFLVAMIAVS